MPCPVLAGNAARPNRNLTAKHASSDSVLAGNAARPDDAKADRQFTTKDARIKLQHLRLQSDWDERLVT